MFAISKDICKKILHNFYSIDYDTFIDEDIQSNVSAIDFNQTVGFLGKSIFLSQYQYSEIRQLDIFRGCILVKKSCKILFWDG